LLVTSSSGRRNWDSNHPILSALKKATHDALIKFMLDAIDTDSEKGSDELADKFLELQTWADESTPTEELEALPQDLAAMKRVPFSSPEASNPEFDFAPQLSLLLREAKRRLKGRPVTKRSTAVLALELSLAGHTWRELAQKLCDCKRTRHDEDCEDRLYAQVKHLKRLCKKHSIPLPTSRK